MSFVSEPSKPALFAEDNLLGRFAVLASGSGSNFEALVTGTKGTGHTCALLIGDRKGAFCFERAHRLGVPSALVTYNKGPDGQLDRTSAEDKLSRHLEAHSVDLVVLAGFMRLLTPRFVHRWQGKLINIHPALLPRHPGAHGIDDSWASTDPDLGVTVHWVDEGMDTGEIIEQARFTRQPGLTREQAEETLHRLEHELYPRVVTRLLNNLV
ncbi:MAG: phosphoribosylglycinamide formyltransferase [Spirochaetales bacterium]|nr:phosphoribosylglycinamide formyltransferase [Spirochaetales bacterium]